MNEQPNKEIGNRLALLNIIMFGHTYSDMIWQQRQVPKIYPSLFTDAHGKMIIFYIHHSFRIKTESKFLTTKNFFITILINFLINFWFHHLKLL